MLLQNSEQKSTIAEKPKLSLRIAYYISVTLLLVLLMWSIFYKVIWGYIIGIAIMGPIIIFLAHMTRIIKGTCPHCGMSVSDVPENDGLTCSACKSRIVVRDGIFWKLTNDPNDVNNSSLPPGMTLQEFTDRKQKIKRYAIIVSVLFGMVYTTIFLVGSLFYGMLEGKKAHAIEELKVAEGTYCVRTYYSNKATNYRTGIKDSKTGEVILTASDGFCQIDSYRWSFQNKPAKVWYNADGSRRGNVVYQLEVNGFIVCTLDQVNSRIIKNEKRMKVIRPLMLFGLLFFNWCMAAVIGYYGVYRIRINRLFGKEK